MMKKNIISILIIILIIGSIIGGVWFLTKPDELLPELAFLEQEGFLDQEGNPLKSPGLIEQNLNSPDESFEVLATKLNKSNKSYQLAFKLENKSNESKEFYLIPISEKDQLQFKEIKGLVNNTNLLSLNKDDAKKEPLDKLYDVEQHKQELRSELGRAYKDIETNNYRAEPIKIVLAPKSFIIAQSLWEIARGPTSDSLKPVYFLVYGSAAGAKEELTILNVHSHPQQGENWEVEFTVRGMADLKIIPADQATIDDDEFTGLYCDNEKRIPQILPGDIIYYPNWQCNGIGKVVHYTLIAGNHTLRFEFADQISYAFNNPDRKIEQQINIIDQEYSTTSTDSGGVPTDNSLGLILWDADKYNGESVYFEAVIHTDNVSGIAYALLCPDSGCASPVSTLTSDTGQTTYKRYRSASAISPVDDEEYTVRIYSNNASYTAYIQAARLIIKQSDATSITATETQIEVGNNENTASESYVDLTDKKIYLYDHDKFDPAPAAYFEATLKSSGYTGTGNTNATDCTATANDDAVGTRTWTDTANACGSNEANASIIDLLQNEVSQYIKVTGFGFELPAIESIVGIVVEIERDQTSNGNNDIIDNSIKIVRGGSVTGEDKSAGADWPTTEATNTFGASDNNWGVGDWIDTDIESADFGVAFSIKEKSVSNKPVDAYIDNIAITVYYTTPGGTGTAYAQLYNKTNSTVVANSIVSVNSTTWTRERGGSALSTNWDTAADDEYVVQIKTDNADATAYIANAKIILTQSSTVDKLETVHQYINTKLSEAGTWASQDFDNRYDSENWDGGTFDFDFEATLKDNGATSGAQMNPDVSASVAGSASYTRQRDTTLDTLTDDTNYDTQIQYADVSSSWLIINVSDLTSVANSTPAISSAKDGPDPIEVGQTITFYVDWTDGDGEGVKMIICKSDSVTAAETPSCPGDPWCGDTDTHVTDTPLSCNYTIQSGDIGTKEYWAFVCDNEPSCNASGEYGTFTASAATSTSLKFDGGIKFEGGIIIK